MGSLIRPAELHTARQDWAGGKLERSALTSIENRCIRDAIILQEQAGLFAVTDGELRRASWRDGFFANVEGFGSTPVSDPFAEVQNGHNEQVGKDLPTVTAKLRRRFPIAVREFLFVREHTKVEPKVTLPSPTFMHPVPGIVAVDPSIYPRLEDYMADVAAVYRDEVSDLAQAGCNYLQLDDVVLPWLCNAGVNRTLRSRGEDPDALLRLYLRTINDALRDRPDTMTVGLYMCRDNLPAGASVDFAEPALKQVFEELEVDCYFLGYGAQTDGEFASLRHLPEDKMVSLGLVDVNNAGPEQADIVASRINDASRIIDFSRLGISPQRGFAATVATQDVPYDHQARCLRFLAETAERIWDPSYKGATVKTRARPSA